MKHSTSTIDKDTIKTEIVNSNTNKKDPDISFRFHLSGFHQDSISQINGSYLVQLSNTQQGAYCPVCKQFSDHVKGHYLRSLQEVEMVGHPLTLVVNVRKFRCKNAACRRKVFSEPLPSLTFPRARNTLQVEERIRNVSLKTTSRIASGLLHEQNIICSQSSCLRRANVYKEPSPAPVAIGLDDYAQKKGHIYGTVIVNQLTHAPITLIPERGGKLLEEYLKKNPQIQYLTRDRGLCFIKVINQALPNVTQICDRFHLIKDMVDNLTEEIASRSRLGVRKQVFNYPSRETVRERIMESLYNMGDERHRRKLKLFIDSEDCMRKGMSLGETARKLNVHSYIICKLMRHHTGRDYMSPEQKSILRHVDELAFEISHGCVKIKDLKEKMKDTMDGHDVERATIEIRNDIREQQRKIRAYNRNVADKKNKSHASVKAIHNLILNGRSSVDSLKELMKDPTVRNLIDLTVRFREMVDGKSQYPLNKWIDRAMKCDFNAMRIFAFGIKEDKEAVQNAIDIYLNNGVLEGTVNKIKAIKRQMFNRASTTLLANKLIDFNTQSCP